LAPRHRKSRGFRRFWVAAVLSAAVLLALVLVGLHRSSSASGLSAGVAPTGNIPGWRLVYRQNFTGNRLPAGWDAYSGEPGGDPYGYWNPANVTVSNGEMHFGTKPNNDPNRNRTYSTGGVAFSGHAQTYGMYLVRMKGDYEPGLRISDIALLWPQGNAWPPEIDFFEDSGGTRSSFIATLHPGPSGNDCCRVIKYRRIDGTKWHTYGVAWTPTTITYTVDGHLWGKAIHRRDISSPGKWPSINMILALQSQNLGPAQPARPIETMTVKWVAEYAPD
jgi:beta-glucanase (GH16 family)